MIKDKETLLSYFIKSFPNFREQWESENNYNVTEDGIFTLEGLCAEFSQYYIDNYSFIEQREETKLFEIIEDILNSSKSNRDLLDLSHSLKSCFLENISQTEAGDLSKSDMGKETRKFFDEWHVYP